MVPKTPSHGRIHGTHKGRPHADKIPAKVMHGSHKGRPTPTIYPRNPWYSCKSMACTRSRDRIHGTHKGRPDADKIPAKAVHGTHKGRLTPTIYPRNPCMERTRVC
ncbi:hypothetical protein EV363DRAFT_1183021 [Boletus edulis]|nr:hypothetical protein EV363DRAFT_1183021 [Boletus edulis]